MTIECAFAGRNCPTSKPTTLAAMLSGHSIGGTSSQSKLWRQKFLSDGGSLGAGLAI
jgi:hypothetical protein